MYCKNCGYTMGERDAVCTRCGAAAGNGQNFCPGCGAQVKDNQLVCIECGAALGRQPGGYGYVPAMNKSRIAAGILGLLVGGLGVHNFYLGFYVRGVVQLVLTFLSCGAASVWGVVEGILILSGRINYDAQGLPFTQ